MAYEVCDFMSPDGSVCGGLYDPRITPPVPCIFPKKEVDRCLEIIASLEPISVG